MRPPALASGFQSCPISAKPIKSTARESDGERSIYGRKDAHSNCSRNTEFLTAQNKRGRQSAERLTYFFGCRMNCGCRDGSD